MVKQTAVCNATEGPYQPVDSPRLTVSVSEGLENAGLWAHFPLAPLVGYFVKPSRHVAQGIFSFVMFQKNASCHNEKGNIPNNCHINDAFYEISAR